MYDRKNNMESELRQNSHQLDLMKMKKGDYMLQCFAVYINKGYSENVLLDGMKLVDIFYCEMEKNKDIISQVKSYEDIEANMKAGKMSAGFSMISPSLAMRTTLSRSLLRAMRSYRLLHTCR